MHTTYQLVILDTALLFLGSWLAHTVDVAFAVCMVPESDNSGMRRDGKNSKMRSNQVVARLRRTE